MMSTKIMHWIGLLICLSSDINCVRGHATTDRCSCDVNGGLQTVLEQTLQTLQTMNERLQAMNESRLESVEHWMKGNDKGT